MTTKEIEGLCVECVLSELTVHDILDCDSAAKLQAKFKAKVRADAIDDRARLLCFICEKYHIPLIDMNYTVDEWEQLKEQKNG